MIFGITIQNLLILVCACVVLGCASVMYASKPRNPMYKVYFVVGACLAFGFILLNFVLE
jgi:hypothetical protein